MCPDPLADPDNREQGPLRRRCHIWVLARASALLIMPAPLLEAAAKCFALLGMGIQGMYTK